MNALLGNKSPPPKQTTPLPNGFGKKPLRYKSVSSDVEDKRKEKPWGQIEDFVDTELDKETMKAQNKNMNMNFRNGPRTQSTVGYPKNQNIWMKKYGIGTEKRAASALDGAGIIVEELGWLKSL